MGFPFWPAETVALDDDVVPSNLLARRRRADEDLLVRFFDQSRSWTWTNGRNLVLLGEDEAVDQAFLDGPAKKPKIKVMLGESYARAIEQMA